jgi:hypothetical protein
MAAGTRALPPEPVRARELQVVVVWLPLMAALCVAPRLASR